MIRVCIWGITKSARSTPQVSVRIGATYASWMPGRHEHCVSKSTEAKGTVGIHTHSFAEDIALEGRLPVCTVDLLGLDEERAVAWWKTASAPAQAMTTLGATCATTVARVLIVAGGAECTAYPDNPRNAWGIGWQPMDVHRFADEIVASIRSGGDRIRAINFIRRFLEPKDSLPWAQYVDAQGLALAMHEELSGKTELVSEIFRALERRRRPTANSVAWRYVWHLERSHAGMVTVRRCPRLVDLLLEALYHDPTGIESRRAIDALTPLRRSQGLGLDPERLEESYYWEGYR